MSDRDGTPGPERNVVVTDIDIPFGRLIVILIKLALAAIPAMIVVWIVIAIIMMLLAAIFGTSLNWHWRMMPWGPGV